MIVAVEGEQPLLDDAIAAIVDDDKVSGNLWFAAVHSDWIEYIELLPSPGSTPPAGSDLARLTPTEAGNPQPMPPEASA
jgi:hypothetical protein